MEGTPCHHAPPPREGGWAAGPRAARVPGGGGPPAAGAAGGLLPGGPPPPRRAPRPGGGLSACRRTGATRGGALWSQSSLPKTNTPLRALSAHYTSGPQTSVWGRGETTPRPKHHLLRWEPLPSNLHPHPGRFSIYPPPRGSWPHVQDGLSGPWANFRRAKMACSSREMVMGGQLPL